MTLQLTLCMLVALSAVPQREQQRAPNAEQQRQADQRGTESAPVTVRVVDPDSAQKRAAEESAEEHRIVTERELVHATWALFVVTAALAIFTGGLFLATVSLAKDAKVSGERTAKKMEESIEATLGTLKHMQEREHRELRAYVNSVARRVVWDKHAGRPSGLRMLWRNSGRSPALHAASYHQTAVFPDTFDSSELTRDEVPTEKQSDGMIGIGRKWRMNVPFPEIGEEEWERITLGRADVYLWGFIVYDDVFGIRHTTRFARRWHHGDDRTYLCRHGNSAT